MIKNYWPLLDALNNNNLNCYRPYKWTSRDTMVGSRGATGRYTAGVQAS